MVGGVLQSSTRGPPVMMMIVVFNRYGPRGSDAQQAWIHAGVRRFTHNARTAWTLAMLRWTMMHMGDGSNGRGHAGAGIGRGDAGEDSASERGHDLGAAK